MGQRGLLDLEVVQMKKDQRSQDQLVDLRYCQTWACAAVVLDAMVEDHHDIGFGDHKSVVDCLADNWRRMKMILALDLDCLLEEHLALERVAAT